MGKDLKHVIQGRGGGTGAVQMVIFGEGPVAIKNARMVLV